jgi:hypothetical protein
LQFHHCPTFHIRTLSITQKVCVFLVINNVRCCLSTEKQVDEQHVKSTYWAQTFKITYALFSKIRINCVLILLKMQKTWLLDLDKCGYIEPTINVNNTMQPIMTAKNGDTISLYYNVNGDNVVKACCSIVCEWRMATM